MKEVVRSSVVVHRCNRQARVKNGVVISGSAHEVVEQMLHIYNLTGNWMQVSSRASAELSEIRKGAYLQYWAVVRIFSSVKGGKEAGLVWSWHCILLEYP